MILTHSIASINGKVREINEDSCFADDKNGLYIVCDGMGGHRAGDLASKTAIEQVSNQIIKKLDIEKLKWKSEADIFHGITELVKSAVLLANHNIQEIIKDSPALNGMGTTLTLCLIYKNKAVMAHVGDSRLYLLRNNELKQLSRDHTFVNEMVSKSMLSQEEAERSPYAHMLLRAIGPLEAVEIDTLYFDVLHGDRILLCTDGLHATALKPNDITEVLQENSNISNFQTCAGNLVNLANQRDGQDNISAIIVRTSAEKSDLVEEAARSQEIYLKIDILQKMFIFNGLLPEELMKVMEIVHVIDFHSTQTIIREGDKGNSLYIILSGSVSVIKNGKQINTLTQGNHFGEMALLNEAPRIASVVANQDTRLLTIKGSQFIRLLQQEHLLGIKMMWNISSELSIRLSASGSETLSDFPVP